MKLAVVLFNLGGPDGPDAIEPFLTNLFSDPAIIGLPGFLRKPLARLIAARRAPLARDIYAKIGGRSPIREETEAQGQALEAALAEMGHEARAFVAMRCWKPFSDEAVNAVQAFGPDLSVLLPLYPQYSTTTTASSFVDWERAAKQHGFTGPTRRICCYPTEPGFIAAEAALIGEARTRRRRDIAYRLLFSAHGLPRRVIKRGDPYQWQVEQSAAAIAEAVGIEDWAVCYQSRVGPLEWIGPSTDSEIERAGRDGKGVIVAPIAFVSEHSETLVELDIEYRYRAERRRVPDYIRVPVVGTRTEFVGGLARLVLGTLSDGYGGNKLPRQCPVDMRACGYCTSAN